MRLLLDEQVPRSFKQLLVGHEVRTVREMGWNGKSNGELLALARQEFDAFVTLDRNLEYQQNITERDIPIVLLIPGRSNIEHLSPLAPRILEILNDLEHGKVIHIEGR
jgi:predicted nuclease of predicted toxin-antitoxin system